MDSPATLGAVLTLLVLIPGIALWRHRSKRRGRLFGKPDVNIRIGSRSKPWKR